MAHNILVVLLLMVIIIEETNGSCSEKECPKGSKLNSKCICECKAGYYRSDVFNHSSPCDKVDCPPEAEKVLNSTYPSMYPTCVCDVRKNYSGSDPLNCKFKAGGCANNDLVRQTGECGCRPGLRYYEGECLPERNHNTSPQGTTTVETMPTKHENSNENGIKLGAGLGGGLGGGLGVLLIGALIFLCIQRRRKMKKNESNNSPAGENIPLQSGTSASHPGLIIQQRRN